MLSDTMQHHQTASAHGCAGVQYVAAPVFGRPDAVQAKKIVNVIAGAEQRLPIFCVNAMGYEPQTLSCVSMMTMHYDYAFYTFCSSPKAVQACYVLCQNEGYECSAVKRLFRRRCCVGGCRATSGEGACQAAARTPGQRRHGCAAISPPAGFLHM